MPRYEYKVVPAPKKAGKIRGVKGTEARFAHELSTLMNEFGADGWEYQRTDTLPCEERSGLTRRTTTFQNMLVFRREVGGAAQAADAVATRSAPSAVPSADAIASIHMAAPAQPKRAEAPQRMTEPAPRPVAVPEPEPDRAGILDPQPEREEVAVMPSFRSAAHKPVEPAFSSRIQEGRTPRLGSARRPDAAGKPTLVTR